jgi:hypothetical protein
MIYTLRMSMVNVIFSTSIVRRERQGMCLFLGIDIIVIIELLKFTTF